MSLQKYHMEDTTAVLFEKNATKKKNKYRIRCRIKYPQKKETIPWQSLPLATLKRVIFYLKWFHEPRINYYTLCIIASILRRRKYREKNDENILKLCNNVMRMSWEIFPTFFPKHPNDYVDDGKCCFYCYWRRTWHFCWWYRMQYVSFSCKILGKNAFRSIPHTYTTIDRKLSCSFAPRLCVLAPNRNTLVDAKLHMKIFHVAVDVFLRCSR